MARSLLHEGSAMLASRISVPTVRNEGGDPPIRLHVSSWDSRCPLLRDLSHHFLNISNPSSLPPVTRYRVMAILFQLPHSRSSCPLSPLGMTSMIRLISSIETVVRD